MVTVVTGGSRSGKSAFAARLAGRGQKPCLFLATAQGLDDEMKVRIQSHKASRPADWLLLEEPVAVPAALRRACAAARTVIVDCVTVWMANLILGDEGFGEAQAAAQAAELLDAARGASSVIIVTNETGSGIVPDNLLARRFRDCAGRANQVLAAAAQEVYLLVSGIPLALKTLQGEAS